MVPTLLFFIPTLLPSSQHHPLPKMCNHPRHLIPTCPQNPRLHLRMQKTPISPVKQPQSSKPPRSLTTTILFLALPAFFTLSLDPLLSLIDTAFISRLGVSTLSAVGISTTILSTVFSLFYFLNLATTPIISASLHNPTSKSSQTLSSGIHLSFLLGISLTFLLTIFSTPLLHLFACPPPSFSAAILYLRIRALAAPSVLISTLLTGALRAYADLQTPLLAALVANIVNIFLDAWLILGLHLGVAGAAIATTISQTIAAIILLITLIRKNRLSLTHLFSIPCPSTFFPFLSAGSILLIRTLSLLFVFAYASTTAAMAGVVASAAHALTRQLWTLAANAMNCFTAAAQAVVADAYASGDRKTARRAVLVAVKLAMMFGAVMASVALFKADLLISIFTKDQGVVDTATTCVRLAAVLVPLNGAVFAIDGALAACGDYAFVTKGIVLASVLAVLALKAVSGVEGVWMAINLLMIARAVVLFMRAFGNVGPLAEERVKGKEM